MTEPIIFRNRDIHRVEAFIPEGHKHIRILISTTEGDFIFQEATVAAIVRAYIAIKTHPTRREIVMCGMELQDRKEGYAEYQLLEEGCDSI